jgi:hypothetical protein
MALLLEVLGIVKGKPMDVESQRLGKFMIVNTHKLTFSNIFHNKGSLFPTRVLLQNTCLLCDESL